VASFFRLFSDASGASHFETVQDEGDSVWEHALTQPHALGGVGFVRVLDGEADPSWHPAPRRQIVVWLRGSSTVEASDGSTRDLEPGDVLLVEDVDGTGHRNRHHGEIQVAFLHLTTPDGAGPSA
jgi:quercetin dioxygenase-like cupin family protein